MAVLAAASLGGGADARAADRLIVRYEPGADRADVRQAAGAEVVRNVRGLAATQVVRVDDAASALRDLRANAEVAWAERDVRVHAGASPSDPRFDEQWSLRRIGAPAAWELTTGDSGVLVAVIDTGVAAHPDLVPNLWTNAGEVAGNSVDDDDNALVDDRRGWDFVDWDGDPVDHNGHGTHVAAIAGARGDDATGTAGVAWRTRIMPLRVLDGQGGGWASNVAQALAYAARMGARVANLSLGGPYSHAIDDVIGAHPDLLVVAAAGNDGGDVDGDTAAFPCELPHANVVCVAASDPDDRLASFSNHGATGVDLAAPGTAVLSATVARHDLIREDFETGLDHLIHYFGWARGPSPGGGQAFSASLEAGEMRMLYDAHTVDRPTPGLFGCRGRMRAWIDSSADQAGFSVKTRGRFESEVVSVLGPGGPWGDTLRFATPNLDNSPWSVGFGVEVWKTAFAPSITAAIDDVVVECVRPEVVPGDVQEPLSGTSMAAPHVSGAAALAFAAEPAASAASVRRALLDGAQHVPSLTGLVATGGRLDVEAAVRGVGPGERSAPSPPPPALPALPAADGWRPGSLDPAWRDGGWATATFPRAMGEPSEHVIAARTGTLPGGAQLLIGTQTDRFVLTRMRADGSPDSSFGEGGRLIVGIPERVPPPRNGFAFALDGVIAPDGSVALLGVRRHDDELDAVVLRLRPDGSLDPAFGDQGVAALPSYPHGRVLPVEVAIDQQGRVLFLENRGHDLGVVRLLPDGRPDPSFGDGGTAWHQLPQFFPGDLDIDPRGRVLVTARYEPLGGWDEIAVLRLRPDGSIDTGFGHAGFAWVPFIDASDFSSLDVGPDERLTVASEGWPNGGFAQLTLTRFLPDGRLDHGFGLAGIGQAELYGMRPRSLEVLADGRAVVGGFIPLGPGIVVRFRRDGRLDGDWGQDGVAAFDDLPLGPVSADASGTVVVAGQLRDTMLLARLRGGRLVRAAAPPPTSPPDGSPRAFDTGPGTPRPEVRSRPSWTARLRGRVLTVRVSGPVQARLVVRQATGKRRVIASRRLRVRAGRTRVLRIRVGRTRAVVVRLGSARLRVAPRTRARAATHG